VILLFFVKSFSNPTKKNHPPVLGFVGLLVMVFCLGVVFVVSFFGVGVVLVFVVGVVFKDFFLGFGGSGLC